MTRASASTRFAPACKALALAGLIAALLALAGCLPAAAPPPEPAAPAPAAASSPAVASASAQDRLCAANVGRPRIERVSEHVWMAIGYDMANTVVISAGHGLVVVDSGSNAQTSQTVRQAFQAAGVPWGPVLALIYTHSHADHVGGGTAWAGPETAIWSTARMPDDLLKQYSLFLPAETMRAMRQIGAHVPHSELPCSSIGNRDSLLRARSIPGLLMPTHTFQGSQTLDIGGLTLVLTEAPGETDDQLMVWLPGERALICGDDFYWAFPNLYTIRGTSPRPVDGWIQSLDRMRALHPEHLVPCHTIPVHGEAAISQTLTNYRDAIQWVRDEVVRRANRGQGLDAIAEEVRLPARLAALPYLQETYGQVDWSARAIYTNYLGWFDGQAQYLYPLPHAEAAAREVELMGGPNMVLSRAQEALAKDDPAWAIHLLAKLRSSGLAAGSMESAVVDLLGQAYRAQAQRIANTNGKGYLLESAYELVHGLQPGPAPRPNERFLDAIPVAKFLSLMTARVDPEAAREVHAAVAFVLPDAGQRYTLTVRRGLAEVAAGEPLPGTPAPVAVLTLNAPDLRRLLAGVEGPLVMRAAGRIQVEGSFLQALGLLKLFRPNAAAGQV